MEGISGRGWKAYWRRRGYRRLNGSGGGRRKREEEGGRGRRRRRLWRMKMGPKIRMPRMSSAKKMMVWVRDAYMRMMMRLANSGVRGMGDPPLGRAPVKEYDLSFILHIYHSFIIPQTQTPSLPSL